MKGRPEMDERPKMAQVERCRENPYTNGALLASAGRGREKRWPVRRGRIVRLNLLAGLLLLSSAALADDFPYHKPPQEMLEVLNAPLTPLLSVSPQRDAVIILQPVRYPPIAEVAQPMLRLAGIRIDSTTNGMHLAPTNSSLTLKHLSTGTEVKI